ncbi:MAG: DUF4190 domain-containing protein [Verrucomicrobiota bacterium]
MPTIKIACPDCGQRVSGDESFLGTTVPCPNCDTNIVFPENADDIPAAPTPPASAEPPPLKDAPPPLEPLASPPSEHIHLLTAKEKDSGSKPTVHKIACPECGQRVSGDDSFLGTTVPCPTCDTNIVFPKNAEDIPTINKPPSEETAGKLNVVSFEKPILKDPDAFDEDDYVDDEPKKPALPKAPRKSGSKKTLPRAVAPAPDSSNAKSAAAPNARVSKAAVLALILGLVSLFFLPFAIGLVSLIPALLLGHTARSRIKNSSGRLLGNGLATTGLCFSYLAVLLTIAAVGTLIAFKGKDRAVQFHNATQAPKILAALNTYAETHQGRYPTALEELIPDYVPRNEKHLLEWLDPDGFEPVPYLYYPGHDLLLDDATTIIIAAPEPDALNRRLVGYLNTESAFIPDEEFIEQMGATEQSDDP